MASRSLRLPDDDDELLAAAAKVDGKSANEFAREAILERIERRRQDPEFQERLKRHMEQHKAALDRLSR